MLISKEELDAGIDFRRSSMPPTWMQPSTVWSAPMGTPSSSGSPRFPSTFSKIWVSFLLGSWVGRDVREGRDLCFQGKLVQVGLDMPPSNQAKHLSDGEKTIYTLHSSNDMMLHRRYVEIWDILNGHLEKWHLSLATPTSMRETNNQSMSHTKIRRAQFFSYQGSQMIAPTNPNRTSNVKTKYKMSCTDLWWHPKSKLPKLYCNQGNSIWSKRSLWKRCSEINVSRHWSTWAYMPRS